jgi:hypothetical protein
MSHSTYALFDHPEQAAAAAKELQDSGTSRDQCSVVFHGSRLDDLPASELQMFETGAASTAMKVGLTGGAVGAIFGALTLGPLGLVGAGALAAVLFGAASGTLLGTLTGAVAGASDADPALKKLAQGIEHGKVLLAVESTSPQAAEHADRVLARHGAHTIHRHLLLRMTPAEKRDVTAAMRH